MPTRTTQTFAERDALEAVRVDLTILVGATVANGFKVKRGSVCGEIIASKKIRRRSRTNAAGAGFAVDSPVGHVEDASVFVAGDVLKNAAGTTVGTVQSVDAVANTVTLTGNAGVAVASGAAVLGSDGSQVAKAISFEESDGVGDTQVSVCIGGPLKEAKLLGLDASAKAELGGVSTIGGIFKF
jgi:hypothetical protein